VVQPPRVAWFESAILKDERISLKKPVDHDREVSFSGALERALKRDTAPLGILLTAPSSLPLAISSK